MWLLAQADWRLSHQSSLVRLKRTTVRFSVWADEGSPNKQTLDLLASELWSVSLQHEFKRTGTVRKKGSELKRGSDCISASCMWLLELAPWVDAWMHWWMASIRQTHQFFLCSQTVRHASDAQSRLSIRLINHGSWRASLGVPASHMFASIRGAVIQHLKSITLISPAAPMWQCRLYSNPQMM